MSVRIGHVVICLGLLIEWAFAFEVPDFVLRVPAGHFAGVSAPCRTLSEARQSAVDDVVRQVLAAMGAQYNYRHVNYVSGDVRGLRRIVDDQLIGTSHGLVMGISQSVVKSSISRDHGMITYFVLVRCSDAQIAEMRRLSRGAKVMVTRMAESGGGLIIDVDELNGVGVVLNSADVEVMKRNRYARLISYYVAKVPIGSHSLHAVTFKPVRLCGSTGRIKLDFGQFSKGWSHYLLGTDVSISIKIQGIDECGREILVKATY